MRIRLREIERLERRELLAADLELRLDPTSSVDPMEIPAVLGEYVVESEGTAFLEKGDVGTDFVDPMIFQTFSVNQEGFEALDEFMVLKTEVHGDGSEVQTLIGEESTWIKRSTIDSSEFSDAIDKSAWSGVVATTVTDDGEVVTLLPDDGTDPLIWMRSLSDAPSNEFSEEMIAWGGVALDGNEFPVDVPIDVPVEDLAAWTGVIDVETELDEHFVVPTSEEVLVAEELQPGEVVQIRWRNAALPVDINGDLSVALDDLLVIFNSLNTFGFGSLSDLSQHPDFDSELRLDVNGDDFLTPLDSVIVVNAFNNEWNADEADLEDFSQGLMATRMAFSDDADSADLAWDDTPFFASVDDEIATDAMNDELLEALASDRLTEEQKKSNRRS